MTRRTLLAAPALALCQTPPALVVRAKRKPPDAWVDYPTRIVRNLPGFTPGEKRVMLDHYGGRRDRSSKASGFFRTERRDGRWWLVDPDGGLFVSVGCVSVTPGRSARNRRELQRRFGTEPKWASETTALLRRYAFNGVGNWSETALLRGVHNPLPYTGKSDFCGSFGRKYKMVHQQPGHLGYPGDAIPVFHPDFEPFCEEYAKSLAGAKDDPFLLGHFSDNELPCPADLLDKSLKLDESDPRTAPGRSEAAAWFLKRKGAAGAAITDDDREAFREHAYERYLAVTTRAIRRNDPNHLCLGPRYHGGALKSPGMWRAAGRHLDAIAVNVYWHWQIPAEMLAMWSKESGKPFLVTEFYAKGDDSGYPNASGAGWIVPTQRERGYFYQNFTLGLLESKSSVGWHWFKYLDNDPEDMTTDPSNRDSNKGIVKLSYDPYVPLLEAMEPVNRHVYELADYFDRTT